LPIRVLLLPSGIDPGGCFRGHGLSLLEKTTLWCLRTRAIPAGQERLRQLLHRTKKIGLYFRGVTALLSPGLVKLFYGKVHQLMKSVISKHYTNNPYTRRLLEKETHFFCVRCFSRKLSLSCGRKGLGGTPQCVSTRRPTSRPRKA